MVTNKTKAFIIVGAAIFFFSSLAGAIWLFELSWWIMFWVVLITGIIAGTIWIILYLRNKAKEKEVPQEKILTTEEASQLSNKIAKLKVGDMFDESTSCHPNEITTQEGDPNTGTTPIYQKQGTGYWKPHDYCILMNMAQPQFFSCLVDKSESEIAEIRKKLALHPVVEDVQETINYLDEQTGRPVTKTVRKSITKQQKEKVEKLQQEEEKEGF